MRADVKPVTHVIDRLETMLIRGVPPYQIQLKTVSIELHRTHMSFDGLCNVFGTLGFEPILGEVEGCQRPLGGVIIAISVNNGSS